MREFGAPSCDLSVHAYRETVQNHAEPYEKIHQWAPQIHTGTRMFWYYTHRMNFDRPISSETAARLGVRDVIARVRQALGTYSNRSFYEDIRAIAEDESVPHALRDTAQKFLTDARKHALTADIVDAIIARRLPRAPDGYKTVEEIRLAEHLGVENVRTTIQFLLWVRGIPDSVLSHPNDWKAYEHDIKDFCIFARGDNGMTTIFFSPTAQQEILTSIRRGTKPAQHVTDEHQDQHSVVQASSENSSAAFAPEHEAQIQALKERLIAILPYLYRGNRYEGNQILKLLTPNIAPHDAQYYALRILALERIARHNQFEDE